MSTIKANFHNEKSGSVVPVHFRIDSNHLVISIPGINELTRWPLNRVHMLHGPADGKQLRLICGSDTSIFMELEVSVNITWLASQCPNFYRKPGQVFHPGAVGGVVAVIFIAFIFMSGAGTGVFERSVARIGDLTHSVMSFEKKSMNVICRNATNFSQDGFKWDRGASAYGYVKEARSRGYTLAQCIDFADFKANSTPSTKITPVKISNKVRRLNDRSLCLGLKFENPEWEAEARGRGFDRVRCAAFLQTSSVSTTPYVSNDAVTEVTKVKKSLDLKVLKIPNLCREAFNSNLPDHWQSKWPGASKPHADEVQRRGLTVQACADIVRLTDSPTTSWRFSGKSDLDICNTAVRRGDDRAIWENRPSYLAHVLAAKRRGLTIGVCRAILNLSDSFIGPWRPRIQDFA